PLLSAVRIRQGASRRQEGAVDEADVVAAAPPVDEGFRPGAARHRHPADAAEVSSRRLAVQWRSRRPIRMQATIMKPPIRARRSRASSASPAFLSAIWM